MTAAIQEPGPWERRVLGSLVKAFLFRRRKDRARDIPPHLGAERFTVPGNSGARVVGHVFPAPHGHARGVVVLAHPDKRYGQHWFVREGWIDALQAHGYAAVTFDFSQYGETRGGSTYLHDDLVAVARHARATHPGLPVHVVGLSLGAYAAANASPRLDFVESLLLESPYPDFMSWYDHSDSARALRWTNAALHRLFPKSYRRIDARRNIPHAPASRILVTAVARDTVTPERLSQAVAAAGPPGRTQYLELDGPEHLPFRASPEYRDAVFAHLAGSPVLGGVPIEDLGQPAVEARAVAVVPRPRVVAA